MEVELRSFQKTVFEVVEVEQHRVGIEGWLRIAVREVQSAGSPQLYVRQFADGALQQFLLLQRITTTCLATATDGIEQRDAAKVGLQITQLVAAHRQNLRHGQLTLREVLTQVDKGMVLVTTGTDATHHAMPFTVGQAIVFAVASSPRQLRHIVRFCPTPLLIKL